MTGLAITGGRVVDPGRGIDGQPGLAITGGRFTAPGDAGPAAETVDASGLVLVPGLVDLHTHLYQGVSHYGIDPDANCLRRGVTTAVDAGLGRRPDLPRVPPLRHRPRADPDLRFPQRGGPGDDHQPGGRA